MPSSLRTEPMPWEDFKRLLWLIKLRNCEPMKIKE